MALAENTSVVTAPLAVLTHKKKASVEIRNKTLGFVIFPTYLDLDFLSPTTMLPGNLEKKDRFDSQDVKCRYSSAGRAVHGAIRP
jgi:hypothetical protein